MLNMYTSETIFFLSIVIEWNRLGSVSAFQKQVLKFIRPNPNITSDVNKPQGIKLLTRLRVELSH